MNINLNSYSLRNDDGSVDVDGTLDKFRQTLEALQVSETSNLDEVRVGINAVFDRLLGKKMPMTSLVSEVSKELGVLYSAELAERVDSVIKSDPAFTQKKGRDGGTFRVKDQPKKSEEKTATVAKSA